MIAELVLELLAGRRGLWSGVSGVATAAAAAAATACDGSVPQHGRTGAQPQQSQVHGLWSVVGACSVAQPQLQPQPQNVMAVCRSTATLRHSHSSRRSSGRRSSLKGARTTRGRQQHSVGNLRRSVATGA